MKRRSDNRRAGDWTFATSCVESDGESITAMTESASQVTYQTVAFHLGEALVALQEKLGYDTGYQKGGLRMSRDWAVSYWKGTYRGVPCYYVDHSRIEHVFVRNDDLDKVTTRWPNKAGPTNRLDARFHLAAT